MGMEAEGLWTPYTGCGVVPKVGQIAPYGGSMAPLPPTPHSVSPWVQGHVQVQVHVWGLPNLSNDSIHGFSLKKIIDWEKHLTRGAPQTV